MNNKKRYKTMRKREFVGITVIGGIVCFICCLLGRNRGFEKGYKDADRMRKSERTQSV